MTNDEKHQFQRAVDMELCRRLKISDIKTHKAHDLSFARSRSSVPLYDSIMDGKTTLDLEFFLSSTNLQPKKQVTS